MVTLTRCGAKKFQLRCRPSLSISNGGAFGHARARLLRKPELGDWHDWSRCTTRSCLLGGQSQGLPELEMPWPKLWPSSTKDSDDSEESLSAKAANIRDSAAKTATEAVESLKREASEAVSAPSSTLSTFTQPETIVAAVVLSVTSLGFYRFYKSYLRRIPQAVNISPGFLRRRSLVGKVTSVGDGDNFRMYHTPGGRLAGWGWLPWRRVPTDKKDLKDQTV